MASHMFCANCQRLLPQGQTVCSFCEGEIRALPAITWADSDYPAPPVPDHGFFACPACQKHFDQCVQVDIPSFRWSSSLQIDACPHCKALLQWVAKPATQTLQYRLAASIHALAATLLVSFLVLDMQTVLKASANSTLAALVQAALFSATLFGGIFMSSREQKIPRRQGFYRKRETVDAPVNTLYCGLATFAVSAGLLYFTPSAWRVGTFTFLFLTGLAALAWLSTLNWRQNRQMVQRVEAPT